MNSIVIIPLVKLLIVHFLFDFTFQPDSWVKDKKEKKIKSNKLWLHVFLHATFSYLILLELENWKLPLLLFIIHFTIDWIKLETKDNNRNFYLDQIAHCVSIIIIWTIFYLNTGEIKDIIMNVFNAQKYLLYLLGYIICAKPASMLIGKFTEKWSEKIVDENNGLKDAGKYIGIIERMLILTFILLKQYELIGFILAAKSIFRFGDLKKNKERMQTEYYLIGTLISFSIPVFIGIILKMALNSIT